MNLVTAYLRQYPLPVFGGHPTVIAQPRWYLPPTTNGHGSAAAESGYRGAIRRFAEKQLEALGPVPARMFVQRNGAPAMPSGPQSAIAIVAMSTPSHGAQYAGDAAYFGPGLVRAAIPPAFYMPYAANMPG